MKTLVLGIGNPILTDDSVGIRIALKLKEENPELEVIETSEVGMALLELVAGYDKAIIIDSIKTEQGKPGELYKLELSDPESTMYFSSSHGLDINTVVELGHKIGYKMPGCVSLYTIEVKDNTSFGEECTKEIRARIPSIIRQIIEEETM